MRHLRWSGSFGVHESFSLRGKQAASKAVMHHCFPVVAIVTKYRLHVYAGWKKPQAKNQSYQHRHKQGAALTVLVIISRHKG